MKLQIKYNVADIDAAIALAQATQESADILEIGQLLILRYGIKAVESFCNNFPKKKIYVDTKLSERPEETVEILRNFNITYISILAGTYHSIIRKACESANKANIQIVIDFINASSLGQSAMEAKTLGASAILLHRENTLDEQASNLENDWQQVRDNTDLPIFIQGKINAQSILSITPLRPQIIIVGDAITRSKNPTIEAETIKKMLIDQHAVGQK